MVRKVAKIRNSDRDDDLDEIIGSVFPYQDDTVEDDSIEMNNEIYLVFEGTFDEYPKVCETMAHAENYINDFSDTAYEEKVFVYRAHRISTAIIDGCMRINE